MPLKPVCAAVLLATCSLAASALTVTEYQAGFTQLAPGKYQLDGFGRGTSNDLAPRLQATPNADPALQPFFDTWNLDTGDIAPGTYSFSSLVVNAAGGLTFSSVTLNSYDANLHRDTVLFQLNAAGTQATGSGTFTVLTTCPVQSCLWIDVTGLQPAGSTHGGYGGTTVVSVVPEPATYGLLALGLVAVGGVLRRRRVPGAQADKAV